MFKRLMPDKPYSAAIGEDTPDGMVWNVADYEYCRALVEQGVLEDRGYMEVNGIVVFRFYLPPPPHFYTQSN